MTEANRKRIGWSLAGVLGVALIVAAIAVAPMQGVQSDGDVIPTARVAEGDVPAVGQSHPCLSAWHGWGAPGSVGGQQSDLGEALV